MRWLKGDGEGTNGGAVPACFMVCGFRIQLPTCAARSTQHKAPVCQTANEEQLKEVLKVVPQHLEMVSAERLVDHELANLMVRDEQEERRC